MLDPAIPPLRAGIGAGYVAKSSGYSVAATDRGYLIDCTGTFTLALPAVAPVGAGFSFLVRITSGAVTLDGSGSETINGSLTALLDKPHGIYLVICTGAAWVCQSDSAVVNIREFGATGDGATDDTTAIQAALNSGSPAVFVPSGTFVFSSLTIPDNCQIYGSGTLKRATTGSITTGAKYCIDATNADNWSIEGVTIDGNKSGQSGGAGFKVRAILVRGATNFRIEKTTWKNVHDTIIEITSATQNNPPGVDTPGSVPSDAIYRWMVCRNFFLDSGRNVDDGAGYSNSMAVQIGSTTQDGLVDGNQITNCMAGILAAAYNKRLRIVNNTCYVDSATYSFRSSGIAVEQMSDGCVVSGNVVEGFREGLNLESLYRSAISNNAITSCLIGINCFASSIGGTAINMREVTISGNTVKGSTSQGITVRKSSGNGAFDIAVSGNVVNGGTIGVEIDGVAGFAVTGNDCTGTTSAGISITSGIDGVVSGNIARANTADGIVANASNNRVAISANVSSGNDYGLRVIAGQTDLTLNNNTLLNNVTKDFDLTGPTSNSVRHWNNRWIVGTTGQRTISADGQSLKFGGDVFAINAGTYNGFLDHQASRTYRTIAQGAVTYKHNAGAIGSKLFMKTGADVIDAANVARSFASDGTNLYEC